MKNNFGLVFTLGGLMAVSAAAIDICIPAQPEIARAFGAAPEAGAILVTGYLIGYGSGQLFWGPLSDRFGRLPPLYAALAIFLAASIACSLATSLEFLTIARGIQGLAGGGAPVIARAIARDQGGGRQTAALISSMTSILGLAPLVAPLLGSALLAIADWRWIFGSLAILGLVLLVSTVINLQNAPSHHEKPSPNDSGFLRNIAGLLREPQFLTGSAVASLQFAGYAGLLAVGAAILQEHYGIGPEAFGVYFMIPALAYIAGSFSARQIILRFSPRPVLVGGALAAAASGIALGYYQGTTLPFIWFWGLVSCYVCAFGLLLPTAFSIALEPAGKVAGTASSIIGAMQVLAGAIGSILVTSDWFSGAYEAMSALMMIAGTSVLLVVLASPVLRSK